MLTIHHLPDEIFVVALEYEGWNCPREACEAKDYYLACERRRTGGLEKAICDYMLRKGKFADNGRFAHVKGFEISDGSNAARISACPNKIDYA